MTTLVLHSVADLCELLQQPYRVVVDAIAELGIRPHTIQSGLAYYADESVDQLRQHLGQREGQR